MKGFVTTPTETVDTMVALLFQGRAPRPTDTVLDPGCGTGLFIDGIIRWCSRRGIPLPQITGVELDPRHIPILREKYAELDAVRIHHADFLGESAKAYNLIVGNPPYVPITALSEAEKAQYRSTFSTARGRFDLYLLFFERALQSLSPGGRLVFITPEKYLYVETARPLRQILAALHVEEIRLFPEDTFGQLVTYPTITVVTNSQPHETRVFRRDGTMALVDRLPGSAAWLPIITGGDADSRGRTLSDICLRISCGVATGADSVFVRKAKDLDPALLPFAFPTVAGRELTPQTREIPKRHVMLVPYDAKGRLLPFESLGELGAYLATPSIRDRLNHRTCARYKPWYAFHETPALPDIMRPKILCKDITDSPRFWLDPSGHILPRHSVYYIVPRDPTALDAIASYLLSATAHRWLSKNSQRASNGYLRLQSRTLSRLPVPEGLSSPEVLTLPLEAALLDSEPLSSMTSHNKQLPHADSI